jgi:hypothetical protein
MINWGKTAKVFGGKVARKKSTYLGSFWRDCVELVAHTGSGTACLLAFIMVAQ